ncbi:hypothetical protein AAC03nite_23580 [Alicyclobacillus acidoterrestris]|nr:hypothetical protein AAC03nite_23580 [Alicyclobacillus acidoterrestris]
MGEPPFPGRYVPVAVCTEDTQESKFTVKSNFSTLYEEVKDKCRGRDRHMCYGSLQ